MRTILKYLFDFAKVIAIETAIVVFILFSVSRKYGTSISTVAGEYIAVYFSSDFFGICVAVLQFLVITYISICTKQSIDYVLDVGLLKAMGFYD